MLSGSGSWDEFCHCNGKAGHSSYRDATSRRWLYADVSKGVTSVFIFRVKLSPPLGLHDPEDAANRRAPLTKQHGVIYRTTPQNFRITAGDAPVSQCKGCTVGTD